MTEGMINVLITTIPGLNLAPTISLPFQRSASVSDLLDRLYSRLPHVGIKDLVVTTFSNKIVQKLPLSRVSELLPQNGEPIVTLRLSSRLRGGKGGFGSQLRAAGGRMSSKRKKNQGENNSSNRNLDGRRLRTVTEAKALAEYFALKPEMEKGEKEKRRKRWSEVVELAERRQEELRSGSKVRVDGTWMEEKEDAGERAREAALEALSSGEYTDSLSRIRASGCGGVTDIGFPKSNTEVGNPHAGSKGPGKSSAEMGDIASSMGVNGSRTADRRRTLDDFDDDEDYYSDEKEDDKIQSDDSKDGGGKS